MPVAAGDDLPQDDGEEGGEESQIQQCRERRAGHLRGGGGDTAGEPEGEKAGEGKAAERQPPGPVGNGGKQEAGDDRARVAEQHLVRMPGDRIEGGRYLDPAGEGGEPQADRHAAPKPGAEEEGAKALAKQ